MKRFTEHNEEWGEFVDIKINAPEVLQRQLKQLRTKSHISIGTVCDAYQPVEEKYQITRKCLEVLRYFQHSVSILTKSSLILRDLDLLKKIKEIEIGFTITTLNSEIKSLFEPGSSSVKERLNALRILSHNGILTWVFVAPILPYLTDSDEEIEGLIKSALEAGAKNITFDSLNPYPKVWNSVLRIIKNRFPEKLKGYKFYYRNKILYEKKIKDRILNIGRDFNIQTAFAF